MQAHRAAATVSGDGTVVVQGVPFPEGLEVEVIVLLRPNSPSEPTPLQGSVRRYDRPFEPAVGADDWEAA